MHMWCFIASRRNFTCWRKQNGPEQHTNQHFFPAERVCSIDGAWVQRGVKTVEARGEEQVSDRARAELSLECPQHASRSPGRQTAPPQVIANRPPSHLQLPLHKTILIPPFGTHLHKKSYNHPRIASFFINFPSSRKSKIQDFDPTSGSFCCYDSLLRSPDWNNPLLLLSDWSSFTEC